MHDLKHILYFETLLDEPANELVKQAVEDGDTALGYNCYYIPETLLNLPGSFSSRLRAPHCEATPIGDYYLTNRNCPYTRAILERAIEGSYNYLSALFGAEACSAMERMEEHFETIKPVKHDPFVTSIIDAPLKSDQAALNYYKKELQDKVLANLKVLGIDTSDDALRAAIDDHNEVSRIITEIGDFRKLDNPTVTGYEFHLIQLVSEVCPHRLILPYLRETLEEIQNREPDPSPAFRARVIVCGSEIDDPEFTKLLEFCGARVVGDRYCFGSKPSREQIEILDGESPFDAICRHYLETNLCPRFMAEEKIDQRTDVLEAMVEEYKADGIVVESMKFCEFWSYEKVLASHILSNERGIPTCQIEKDYTLTGAGQLRTRFQAFVEGLEIKKIETAGAKGKGASS
ncbi:MAG: 2-hydroxyacyl-CoA dehydratase [Clostridia bacterium]|nr:2-hydroxyacyl-CoA dehydratase [Clostridia bacterium]MBP5459366.1 2-hydroxyacyl-CoA dehydratase [Clostridia bacterium]